MTNWRWTISGLALVTVILLLTMLGCGQRQPPPEKVKLRLVEVMHTVFYAPLYVAINKGYFSREELEIELSASGGWDKIMTALVSGEADLGLGGPEISVYGRQQKAPENVYSFAQLAKRDGSFLVARKAMPSFQWADLKGQTLISSQQGGLPEMVNKYILKQNNLLPQTDLIIIQNIQPSTTPGAFKSGIGDFIQLFEPTASLLEKEGVGYVVASYGTVGAELPFSTFLATEKYLQNNPAAAQKFTNAIYRAQLWLASHTSEEIAATIAPAFPDLDRQVLLSAVQRYKNQDTWATNPLPQQQSFVQLQKIMATAGELKEQLPLDQLVVTKFAAKALETVKPDAEPKPKKQPKK